MAGLIQKDNGVFNVNWRYGKKLFNRSTGTKDEKDAQEVKRRVEETLWMLKRRLKAIPADANVSDFIFNGGQLSEDSRPLAAAPLTLQEMFDKYLANLAAGAKEENSLYTERIHRNHALRLMGKDRLVSSIDRSVAQDYVKDRLAEGVKPYTIGKELKTLRMIWVWASKWEGSEVEAPTWEVRDLSFPKEQAKHPFQTYNEINAKIERGGLTRHQEDELWDCLFLRHEEIAAFMDHAEQGDAVTHAMIVFAALTGARRSEMLRSHISDFNFQHKTIAIREKKRKRGDSYRTVDMHFVLEGVMKKHLDKANHPGGQLTFCNPDRSPINLDQATSRFRKAIRSHKKFCRLRGWHVLRHSFISVLCQKGVDQRIISLYVGHQTPEMEERYRHLIPAKADRPIDKLLA